jgi:hypothetical protein
MTIQESIEQFYNCLRLLDNNQEALLYAQTNESGGLWFNETADNYRENASEELRVLVGKVLHYADQLLITQNSESTRNAGQANFANIQRLELLGYHVTKGESDSFGWLSGVIRLKNFNIVYG